MPVDITPLLPRATGVDVSLVQGACDFRKLAAGGFDFVIPKVSEGTWRDKTGPGHIEDARAAGLLVPAAYHVLEPHAPTAAQVKLALEFASTYDLDICLDFEVGAPTDAIQALEFAEGIIYGGRRCLLYSFPDFMRRLRGTVSLALLAQKTLYFAADYPDERVQPLPTQNPWVPEAWGSKWAFWQWSGNGGTSAPGIPMVVDHVVFNGSRGDLANWMTANKSETRSNG